MGQIHSHKRIVPTRMERMALADPEKRKKASLNNTIFDNGMAGIGRARWIEATGRRKKGRNELFVYIYHDDRYISQLIHGIFY